MQAQVSKPSYATVVKYRKPVIRRRRVAIPIVAPTPEREADTDFAAILGQDWELYEGEESDIQYTTWPPVLSAQATMSSGLPLDTACQASMLPLNQEHNVLPFDSDIEYTSWPPVLSGLPIGVAYQSSMLSPIQEHGNLDARSIIMPITTAGYARPPLVVVTAGLPEQGPSTDTDSPASSATLSSPLDSWEPVATSTPLPKWTWVETRVD
ncbi:uncharacterized protein C8Q71DRAFT_248973 [Rhodofomes roseus]|uniref:Uncharacterized protein n=1 Tax=Rhodofomes roseus TaxID=34475 RepID=A0ABQ8K782_9APHY|nr:uncharacterized protein C8Q71DRAFT_248973 [Rhodofomes roseus]KAH9833027.1 hypothetical protein C8Q71DRAFT_248973 [Rhodofomes roseus]